MKKNIFAVCDLEVAYAYSFMEYVNQKRNLPFEIQAFTGADSLIQFARDKRIEILLISDKTMCSEIKDLDIGQIVILSEGGSLPGMEKYPNVYKYQSSENVIREVMSCYGSEQEEQEIQIPKRMTEIIGVYSPNGRSGKTSFALTLGQILAREKSVLYLNLEEYAGFEGLFEKKYERTLSDVLYFVRQKHKNLAHKISGMIESLGNLDYLPPARSLEDLKLVTDEEWYHLLDTLSYQSAYEVLILDLGDGINGLFSLLNRCNKVYMPVLFDWISQCKLEQLELLLKQREMSELLKKTEKLQLPIYTSPGEGKYYVEQLVWSELGDYVRNLLRKEERCGETFFAQ